MSKDDAADNDNGHGQRDEAKPASAPGRNGKGSTENRGSNISQGRGNGNSEKSGRGGHHEGSDAISEN